MGETDVTLQEAAELLGVHYMTAYRYVRLGLLPARKEGAVWRVERADLDEFRTDTPASAARGAARKRAPWPERLEARLIAGDSRGAWGVIEAALAAGTEIDEVYVDILAPAMASIGERWARGDLDIGVEHRATGIAMRIVGRLGPRFSRRGRTRGGVVLGAPSGERHGLPVALLADLVRGAGFEVSDLGADTPPGSFVHAAQATQRLVCIGISVSNPGCLPAAAEVVEAVRVALPDVPILLGGGAVVGEEHARMMGADGWGRDGRAVIDLLDSFVAGRRMPAESPAAAGGDAG